MKIEIDINDAIALEALKQSVKQKVGINTFLQKLIEESLKSGNETVSPLPDEKQLISQLVENSLQFHAGQKFMINELYDEEEWKTLPAGLRKKVGKTLKHELETKELAKHVGRNSANMAIYISTHGGFEHWLDVNEPDSHEETYALISSIQDAPVSDFWTTEYKKGVLIVSQSGLGNKLYLANSEMIDRFLDTVKEKYMSDDSDIDDPESWIGYQRAMANDKA